MEITTASINAILFADNDDEFDPIQLMPKKKEVPQKKEEPVVEPVIEPEVRPEETKSEDN